MRKSDVELTLSKGITGRTINRAKLVKRATQVRSKDGKIYTRMQWVDPNKDMVTPEDTVNTEEVKENKPKVDVELKYEYDDVMLEATKTKIYDTGTQKGFIDKNVDSLSKEEKQAMITKFGIEWKRNQHESIDWKNAVMALKQYLYDNPTLMGADHLPKENNGETTLDATDRVNDFCNKLSREELYDLMKKYKIYDDVDPRTVPEWASKKEGGDGTGAIRHMKNMMALKKYLKENTHLMDNRKVQPVEKKKDTTDKKDTPTKKENKTPNSSSNSIETILNKMSNEEKYSLMRKLGIADSDPRQDPRYDKLTGDGTAPIRHMKNMMELKKKLALNPEYLKEDLGEEGVRKEKGKTKKEQEKQDKSNEVKELLSKLSKESKLALLKKFANEPEIKNRERKDNPNIDYMRSMMALKSFLEKNPDKLQEVGDMAEFEELMNLKIPVKMIEKILRDIVGIKSTQIDYAVVVEKGKEWKFGISSFAMIQTNDDGVPVLSVVDTGDDGTDWQEYEYPMSQIRDFIEKAKKDKAKAKEDAKNMVKEIEVPLHKKSPTEIEKALNKGVDKHYTEEVGEAMKPILAHYWDSIEHSNNLYSIAGKSYMTFNTLKELMGKYGVSVDSKGHFDSSSDNWLRIACHDRITSTKTMNANDYLFTNKSTGETTAFALKESAKQWTSEERKNARGELISTRMEVGKVDNKDMVHKSLSEHINNGTMFVPFDLITDMLADGVKFTFEGGNGCHYHKASNTVKLSSRYANHEILSTNPKTHELRPRGCHPMTDACAHEFAHAIDGYFSGSNSGYLNWDSSNSSKYVDKKYQNCVRESYYSKVDKSNPAREVVKVTFNGQDSYYHKDEWMSIYESRVYGARDSDFGRTGNGTLIDHKSGTALTPMNSMIGVEHWSENVSRYAMAFDLYREYTETNQDSKITMDEWAENMYNEYRKLGLGDDHTESIGEGFSYRNDSQGRPNLVGSYQNRNEKLMQTTGYLYHKMKSHYPVIWEGINHILNRPDFRSDNSTSKPTELASQKDFARKSLLIVRR